MDSVDNGRVFDPANSARLDAPERQQRVPYAAIRAALGPFSGLHVADIGSGSGYFSFALLDGRGPPMKIAAIDLSAKMNLLFQQRLKDHLLGDRVVFHEGKGEALPLADSSVSVVMMGQVFHEFADPLAALKEAHRVLQPGGKILIVDWELPENRSTPPESGPPYDHRYAEDDVKSKLNEAGFMASEKHDGFVDVYAISAKKSRP